MPLLVAAPHRKIARSRCVIFSIKKMLWVTGYTLAQNIQFQPNGLQRDIADDATIQIQKRTALTTERRRTKKHS